MPRTIFSVNQLLDYKFGTLLAFSFIDVALYSSSYIGLSIAFTIIFYLFVFLTFLHNIKTGLLYLISFNLLTIGWGNYNDTEYIAYNYYGLRVGRFTLNICAQFIIAAYLLIKCRFKNVFCTDRFSMFFIGYFLWTLLVGVINCLFGRIYTDNFVTELFRFLPVLFWSIYLRKLDLNSLIKLFRYVFAISVISIPWALLLEKKMDYSGYHFVIFNSLNYIIPAGVFILSRYYNRITIMSFMIIFLATILTNSYFVSGKTVIIFLCTFFWVLSKNRVVFIVTLLSISLVIPTLGNIIDYFADNIDNIMIENKLKQVSAFLSTGSLMSLASLKTSVGNLSAELLTLLKYFSENPIDLVLGKGMGAGIPDIFGFLRPFTHAAGYKLIDGYRNDYVGLHLSIYVVFLEGGIFILTYYCKLLWELVTNKKAISFLGFLMLFLVFTAGKDYFLLTFILLRISYLLSNNNTFNKIDR